MCSQIINSEYNTSALNIKYQPKFFGFCVFWHICMCAPLWLADFDRGTKQFTKLELLTSQRSKSIFSIAFISRGIYLE